MHFRTTPLILTLSLLIAGLSARPGHAQVSRPLALAVAANFSQAAGELGKAYTSATGTPVQITVSSTGRLFAQIKSGAPYDLFLAADQVRPERLFDEGLAETPVVYARGRVVFWSKGPQLCGLENWRAALQHSVRGKIGIANPATAPYGAVIRKILEKEELWQETTPRLVYGSNVGQAFQYATMSIVDGSFIAASQLHTPQGTKGCSWEIPEAMLVTQKGCVLTAAKNKTAAENFLAFLTSEAALTILQNYGYQ